METFSPRAEPGRKGYNEDEVADIYSLGKLWLETGYHKRAEAVMSGLNEVAPHFAPAWLGTAFLRSMSGDIEGGLHAAETAVKLDPENDAAMLYVVTLSLTLGDVSAAGTYLGEVGDRLRDGKIASENVARLYRMQLARYQGRGR